MVLPFFFLFNQGILMQGSWGAVLSDTFIGAILTLTSCVVLHGYVLQRRLPLAAHLVFIVAAGAMFVPNLVLQCAAAAVSIGLFFALYAAAAKNPA